MISSFIQSMSLLCFLLWIATPLMLQAKRFRHEMRVLPENHKYIVDGNGYFHHEPAPCAQGWYFSVGGVVKTTDGLLASYRKSDFHTALTTDIMVADSFDGGKTWENHRSIAHADVWNQKGCWVAPQISRLLDGRIVIICDFGVRTPGQDWPMLSAWQKPNRGMANYLFWSYDQGKSWSEPVKIDDVGGEPGYLTETDRGVLLFTRTRSKMTDQLWNPPAPWFDTYYFNEAVLSYDGGDSWEHIVPLADDPYHGDCEVGTVDLGNDRLMAITRIGFGNGKFCQPSRIVLSEDGGESWQNPRLTPFYAQRPIIRKLSSGKLFLHYRNRWGTPAIYAALIDPDEALPYEPAIFIFEEERCKLHGEELILQTDEGYRHLVTYGFYPAQSPATRVEIVATLKVDQADIHGCNISAGCWVRFKPNRVCLADRPEEGFDIDTSQWHQYRIIRENGRISIDVDGELRLSSDASDLLTRLVQIGNRIVKRPSFYRIGHDSNEGWKTRSKSHWKQLSVKVENIDDDSICWNWEPRKGYPDSFRRERIIALDVIASHAGHTGYGGSTELEDGSIVVVDYTVGGNGGKPATMPFIRSYHLTESMFSQNFSSSPSVTESP